MEGSQGTDVRIVKSDKCVAMYVNGMLRRKGSAFQYNWMTDEVLGDFVTSWFVEYFSTLPNPLPTHLEDLLWLEAAYHTNTPELSVHSPTEKVNFTVSP